MLFSSFTRMEDLPEVVIIIPIQNEEKVIEAKLNSILKSDYPKEKISIYLGLDACTDQSKGIIETKFSLPNISLIEFSNRTGKPEVLNTLLREHIPAGDALLIFTDANIIFSDNTLFELVKYFKDPQIGLVDANIQSVTTLNHQEREYWDYESDIKYNESLIYGIIPGPSGGCYAIRRDLFTPIPRNFLVDDFYIGFSVLTRSYKSIFNKEAICYEDVVTSWREEFFRKIRISTGNFQNLWYFKRYAFGFNDLSFVFVSHKVLRWKTPFMLLMLYYLLLLKYTLFILIVTLFLPLFDLFLSTFGIRIKTMRRFNYFIIMNIAVFLGFVKFIKGVRNNVWQPTTRK
jgi:cellulose synthase/poly-beta-1,6-N-acetylglucosamine synthase-like glycosyltransferase